MVPFDVSVEKLANHSIYLIDRGTHNKLIKLILASKSIAIVLEAVLLIILKMSFLWDYLKNQISI